MKRLMTCLFLYALVSLHPSKSFALSRDCEVTPDPQRMATCAAEAAAEADADLNKLVKWMQVKTTPAWQSKLSTLQQSWSVFRKQQCELEGAYYEGGQHYSLVMGKCYTRLARARIRELQNLDCVRGTALVCGN